MNSLLCVGTAKQNLLINACRKYIAVDWVNTDVCFEKACYSFKTFKVTQILLQEENSEGHFINTRNFDT